MSLKPAGRLSDKANCPNDGHGCKGCTHNVTGPAVTGSTDVTFNSLPALRVGDAGIHAACCGPNTWTAAAGSATVFINGLPAHRMGDATTHCGGCGKLISGSSNVLIGDSSSSGAGSSSSDATCGICALKKGAVPPPTEKAPSANPENSVTIGNNVVIGSGGGSKPEEDEKPEPKESDILKKQNKIIEDQKAKFAAGAIGATVAAGVLASKASGKDDSEQTDEKDDISFVFIDEETGEPLNRIKSKILYPDKNTNEEIRSSGDGLIEFKDVDKGSYGIETSSLDQFHKKDIKMWIGNTYGVAKLEKKDTSFPDTITQPENVSTQKKYICDIKEYKVQKGEIFSSIAASHNLSFEELGYFNWKTTDKKEILNGINADIGSAELTEDEQDIQFGEPKKPGILFVPDPWKEEGLESDNSYAVYAKKVMHKNQVLKIGLFFDGTSNSDFNEEKYSNVYNLYRNYSEIPNVQERIYILGVGVEANPLNKFFGDGFGSFADQRFETAAFEINKRIQDYIDFYKKSPEKIECDIFGFSRGACMARHFVNLVHYKKIDFEDRDANKLLERGKFKVNFLGIYDSVGSFALPNNKDYYEFHVDNKKANYTYHLVSEDERRENFDLQSVIPGGGEGKHTEYHEIAKISPFNRIIYDEGNVKEEIWPGVHSDIGGGYLKNGFEQDCDNNLLSYVYLKKMNEIAIKYGVPFKDELEGVIGKNETNKVKKIESKIEEIDSYYQSYPNLYKEHLKYNKIQDYYNYSVDELQRRREIKEKFTPNRPGDLDRIKMKFGSQIAKARAELDAQKKVLLTIVPESTLNEFLGKYYHIEKYKHRSHNPFNKKQHPDTYKGEFQLNDPGIGFDPNIDKDNAKLYREFYLNFMHRAVSEIAIIEAESHDLGKDWV